MKKIDGKESNTVKGARSATEFNKLFNKKVMRHRITKIQVKKHKVGTYEIEKISLLCFDDKLSVSNNGTDTLAYFQKELS